MNATKITPEFQVFVKPIGSICNLACRYCYYLDKQHLYPEDKSFRMSDEILEQYIVQHIAASSESVINFSWHGGEPTLLGIDYFRKIVTLQHKHCPSSRRIVNAIQTNGTLLNDAWCSFLKESNFAVGLSFDGPKKIHDRYRVTKEGKSTFHQTLNGYDLLQKHKVNCDLLCVVNAYNVKYPLEIYRFFKQINVQHISFLPLVDRQQEGNDGKNINSITADDWGIFLCTIFDEWLSNDIGRIKVQIFEEAARTAFGQDHSLCIFRPTCGNIPVIEHNGDFYSCDHYVDKEHCLGNITENSLLELLENPAQKAFGQTKLDTLPPYCVSCEVRSICNGGCPKNRFIYTPEGDWGLNYLCAGYKRFFNHCKPLVSEIAALWKQQLREQQTPVVQYKSTPSSSTIGRNDPCPCGSGLKYKKCCMNN